MKKFALAGNPNCGKTTLFNSITGATAHVGNWPGVTVDKREGQYKKLDETVSIIDLPGIYSLSPYTPEEVISRNFISDEHPDCVIDVVDATNLERNLYLTSQILEMDVPVVIALNMSDLVRKNGESIDLEKLRKELGVPVVEISALHDEGVQELMKVAYEESKKERKGVTVIKEQPLLGFIQKVESSLEAKKVANPLFHAIKLVELDEIESANHEDLVPDVKAYRDQYQSGEFGSDFEALIADARYHFIANNLSNVVKRKEGEKKEGETKSDKIDKVLTHRIWALPLFVVLMFFIFHITFSEDILFLNRWFGVEITGEAAVNFFTGMGYEGEGIGIPSIGVFLQSWFGWATGSLIEVVSNAMPAGAWYTSLVCDGLLSGLDAVLSFIPQIMILFLFIAILEDSGYMARVAFILDRAFRRFGLSGKAFIPMLTGFGCSVPAIMATRTLEDEREKNRTIRLMTCFSCGAKAPIWALIAGIGTMAGFAGDIFVFSIYFLGIVLAIVYALFMKFFSKDTYVSPFIMELPAYHLPQFRNVMAHLWEKLKHYVIKAGTIIAAATIVIWFLSSFSWKFEFLMEYDAVSDEWALAIDRSILADFGRGLGYFFYPLGWSWGADGWKYSVATITGLIAKEQVVDTMAVLGLSEETVGLTISQAYSFAIYNLFTIPCFAAIGAAHGEQKGKQFWLTMLWWFAMSYCASLVFFWIGESFAFHWALGTAILVIVIALIVGVGFIVNNRNKKARLQEAQ